MIFLHLAICILLVLFSEANWILSIDQSQDVVRKSNLFKITIKTTQNIPSTNLRLYFDPGYQFDSSISECRVNGTVSECLKQENAVSLQKEIVFNYDFLNTLTYELQMAVINPYYSNNFEVRASSSSGVFFTTTGIASVVSETVICRAVGSSSVVGESSIGTFTVENQQKIPTNSQISMSIPTQTTFNNVFNSAPSCSMINSSLPCSITTIFGSQILQISSISQTQIQSLQFEVNSINNPPYNNSFVEIQMVIQDSLGRDMETCTFTQQKPTTLQTSKDSIVNNWISELGAESTTSSIYLNTYFTTLSNQTILITFPSELSIAPLSPAVSNQSLNVGGSGRTHLYVTNMTVTSSSALFSAIITNPSFALPLNIAIYTLFNETNFRQQFYFSVHYLELTLEVITVSNTLAKTQTMATTQGNFKFQNRNLIDKTESGGVQLSLQIEEGIFICENIETKVTSNFNSLTITSCTQSILTLQSITSITVKSYWVQYPIINYFSTKPHSIQFSLSTLTDNYAISQGSYAINLVESSSLIIILNTNPILKEQTTIQISESDTFSDFDFLSYRGSSVQRRIILTPPNNLVFGTATSIVSLDSSKCTVTSVISMDETKIQLLIEGQIALQISQIGNPISYSIGTREWQIQTLDSEQMASSQSTSIQSPEYSPAQSKIDFSMSNTIIQSDNNQLSVTIQPQLQYAQIITSSSVPSITITLSDSLILDITQCTGCTLISSNKVEFPYFGVLMQQNITIKNSEFPQGVNQTIICEIKLDTFVYETIEETYTLQPLEFVLTSAFSGMFGEIGLLEVSITQGPKQDISLAYDQSNVATFLQTPTCESCDDTSLTVRGKVNYFQSQKVTIIGQSEVNGVNLTFARSVITVLYPCSELSGCRICENVTTTTNSTNLVTLTCNKCFSDQFTVFTQLYQNQCLDACPIKTYSSGISCETCLDLLCYNCTSASSCSECNPGLSIFEETCVSDCPDFYTKNSTHCVPRAIVCPLNCINCPDDNLCLECGGVFLLLDDVCYDQCPSGYFESKEESTGANKCELFIPPEQAQYFPFIFLISSVIFLTMLIVIKCFEKRSLVMGNFISILSIFQFASFMQTIVYILIELDSNLFLQAFIFIVFMGKLLTNLIFIIYFLRNIRVENQFTEWLNKEQENETVYSIVIVLSSLVSFQIIRFIYSRFMGFKMFFGKFSSGLIFKPINYFSIAYTIVFSAPLILLCIRAIEEQDGYKTSIFYSSVETIILEVTLLVSWIVDWKRGNTDQFFDFQVYKISNEFEDSTVNPVALAYQNESGGSTHEMFKSYQKLGSKVNRTQEWKQKSFQEQKYPNSLSKDALSQEPCLEDQVEENNKIPLFSSETQEKKSLFKTNILKDWRKMQKGLPQTSLYNLKKNRAYISKSPLGRDTKKRQSSLKKSSSVQKISVKFPNNNIEGQNDLTAGQKIKRYFHIIEQGKTEKDYSFSRSILKPQTQRRTQAQVELNEISDGGNFNEGLLRRQRGGNPMIQELNEQEFAEDNSQNLEEILGEFSENISPKQQQQNEMTERQQNIYLDQFSSRKLKDKDNGDKKLSQIVHQSFDKFTNSKKIMPLVRSHQKIGNNDDQNDVDVEMISQQLEKYNNSQKKQQHSDDSQQLYEEVEEKGNKPSRTGTGTGRRKKRLPKKKKIQKQTQKLYLQRLSSNKDEPTSLSKKRRYKELSNF